MPDRVLVPMDGSEKAEDALEYALSTYDADVSVLFVADLGLELAGLHGVGGTGADELREAARQEAEPVFETAESIASDHGTDVDVEFQVGGITATIIDYADERGADEIVIGSHGRQGASRVLLGSVAEAVARRSPIPVTIVK